MDELEQSLYDYWMKDGLYSDTVKESKKVLGGLGEGTDWKKMLGDKYMMGNITGLASTLMQAAALPSMLKQAKLQNQSLAHNLATAKEEQARRNKNISGFNQPRSAFTQQVV